MPKVSLINWDKKSVGQVDLPPSVFGVEVSPGILHEVVQWQLAKRRAGTHMVKSRSFVSGGGKKPCKQKGAGNARQGSSRSPLMPGGAKVFGPIPKSYAYELPKKVRKLGLAMALSQAVAEGKLQVFDSLSNESGKTKDVNKKLAGLGLEKGLLIDLKTNTGLARSTKNLRKFKFLSVEGANVFDLLKYENVLMSQQCVAEFAKNLGEKA